MRRKNSGLQESYQDISRDTFYSNRKMKEKHDINFRIALNWYNDRSNNIQNSLYRGIFLNQKLLWTWNPKWNELLKSVALYCFLKRQEIDFHALAQVCCYIFNRSQGAIWSSNNYNSAANSMYMYAHPLWRSVAQLRLFMGQKNLLYVHATQCEGVDNVDATESYLYLIIPLIPDTKTKCLPRLRLLEYPE